MAFRSPLHSRSATDVGRESEFQEGSKPMLAPVYASLGGVRAMTAAALLAFVSEANSEEAKTEMRRA
jgi:hypothetical protein